MTSSHSSALTKFRNLSPQWQAFWIALLVRLLYMTLARQYHVRPYGDHFAFGWEMGRIARALATGYGYADPFIGHTGPTAWVTPGYPLIMAGVFKLTGVYTQPSAWILIAINCFFNSLVVVTTWEIANRCFNRSIALWSIWIWALYPAAMQYAVKWIWEMSLTGLLFSCVIVLALRMRNIGGPQSPSPASAKRWALFGLLWGLISLCNPALVLFLPACGLWILAGSRQWPRQIPSVLLATLICAACIAPWTLRNYRVFHQFVPMRGNFGAELRMGNGPDSVGLPAEYDHPFQSQEQLKLYRDMGEIPYSKMRGAQAMAIIRANPARFADISLRRLDYFWFSVPHPGDHTGLIEGSRTLNFAFASLAALLGLALALRRRVPAAWLFLWAFALIPFSYYFVTVQARFRHPLEPLIVILSVYLFQSSEKRLPHWLTRQTP